MQVLCVRSSAFCSLITKLYFYTSKFFYWRSRDFRGETSLRPIKSQTSAMCIQKSTTHCTSDLPVVPLFWNPFNIIGLRWAHTDSSLVSLTPILFDVDSIYCSVMRKYTALSYNWAEVYWWSPISDRWIRRMLLHELKQIRCNHFISILLYTAKITVLI